MIPLMLSTIITCSEAFWIANRVTSVVGLTPKQKAEIIMQLREYIPTCPIKVTKDESPKK